MIFPTSVGLPRNVDARTADARTIALKNLQDPKRREQIGWLDERLRVDPLAVVAGGVLLVLVALDVVARGWWSSPVPAWAVALAALVLAARLRRRTSSRQEPPAVATPQEAAAPRQSSAAEAAAAAPSRRGAERFDKAFRAVPDAIMISTLADGRIVDVNESIQKQLGYSREEVLGKTGVELRLWVEPEDRSIMTRLLREGGTVRNFELQLTRKTGETRWALLSGEIVDLEGETCFVMALRDITERRGLAADDTAPPAA